VAGIDFQTLRGAIQHAAPHAFQFRFLLGAFGIGIAARVQLDDGRAGVKHGLRVNAGHGLHYTNVQPIAAIPDIHELNIGHAIVAHALFAGFENAVREMKAIMVASRLAASR